MRSLVVLLLSESSLASALVEVHEVFVCVEAGEELVDDVSHGRVRPVSGVEFKVAYLGEDSADVLLGRGDGECGAAELG